MPQPLAASHCETLPRSTLPSSREGHTAEPRDRQEMLLWTGWVPSPSWDGWLSSICIQLRACRSQSNTPHLPGVTKCHTRQSAHVCEHRLFYVPADRALQVYQSRKLLYLPTVQQETITYNVRVLRPCTSAPYEDNSSHPKVLTIET